MHRHKDHLYKFTYIKYVNIYFYNQEPILSEITEGLHLCFSEKQPVSAGDNLFPCKKGSLVSYTFICNGRIDCPFDNSDEMVNCSLFTNIQNSMKKFPSCSSLFYMKHGNSCIPFFPQIECSDSHLSGNDDVINDLVADLGPKAEDEPQLLSLLTSPNKTSCSLPYQIPCIYGHTRCYNISHICKYTLNEQNPLIPCRNGNHLQNCREFQCNSMFKCTNFYCIHYSYVSDDKWDCPNGEDESSSLTCSGMLKCQGPHMICIHLNNVCDNEIDCPDGDDELLCSLTNVKCIYQCDCLGLAITCKRWEINLITLTEYPYVSVYFDHVYQFELSTIKDKFPHTIYGTFLSNNVVYICHKFLPFNMIYINLSFNNIYFLYKSCFRTSQNLRFILLANNLITHIQEFAFWPLLNVSVIDLSNNPILVIAEYIIPFVHVTAFSMKNSTPLNINRNTFLHANIKVIDVSDFHICCTIPISAICMAKRTWYMNCDSLFAKTMIKHIFHSVFGFVLFINFTFFVAHKLSRIVQTAAFRTIVLFLNLNNLFCLIYLCCIGIADLKFQNNYIVNDIIWRSSHMCFSAFTSILNYIILNQILHIFMSTSRLMVVIFPITTKFKNSNFVFKCICYIYVTVVLLTISVTFIMQIMESVFPHKMCFPFIDPTNSVKILYRKTWLVSISQLVCLFTICIQSTLLLKGFWHSKQTTNKSIADVSLKRSLVIALIMGIGSVAACWLPTSIVYITTLILPKYPINLIYWTIIVIIPLTSLINPTVFILMKMKKAINVKRM